jgi:hypothetical protein
VLGLAEGVESSPAVLLRPGNLAVGLVSPDAETALESIAKFGLGGAVPADAPLGRAVEPVPRTREAAPGTESTLVMVLEPIVATGDLAMRVVAEVVAERARARGLAEHIEVVHPVVPGRRVALLVLRAAGELSALERRTEKAWPAMSANVDEDELAAVRPRLAAAVATAASGPLGRARLCAAAAAGDVTWRTPADLELEIISLSAEQVNGVLAQLPGWDGVPTTASGVLPVPKIGTPPG